MPPAPSTDLFSPIAPFNMGTVCIVPLNYVLGTKPMIYKSTYSMYLSLSVRIKMINTFTNCRESFVKHEHLRVQRANFLLILQFSVMQRLSLRMMFFSYSFFRVSGSKCTRVNLFYICKVIWYLYIYLAVGHMCFSASKTDLQWQLTLSTIKLRCKRFSELRIVKMMSEFNVNCVGALIHCPSDQV